MFREKLRIRLMLFEKILRNLAKTPCSDCNMGRGGNTGVRSSQQAQQASTRLRILRCSGPLPEQSNCLLGRGSPVETSKRETLTACQRTPAFRKRRLEFFDRLCKNSTRQGAVFGLPKSLPLRASPRREASALGVQTGAAIRPTCGRAAIPVCRLIRLFAGTARCRSPAPSSPPWWPRSG